MACVYGLSQLSNNISENGMSNSVTAIHFAITVVTLGKKKRYVRGAIRERERERVEKDGGQMNRCYPTGAVGLCLVCGQQI